MKYFYQILIHVNLYINTSAEHCEIALFKDEELKQHQIHEQPMEHSTVLHDLIQMMLLKEQLDFKNLSCIALLNGPGSYTGLRIGLAAAKGFCYALDIPLVLFNKIRLHCSYYRSGNKEVDVLAYLETARMGEYFFCLENANEEICPPMVQEVDFIKAQLESHSSATIISSNESDYDDLQINVESIKLPIDFIAKKIAKRLRDKDFDEIYRAEPFYLKKVHVNTPKKRF